ncbi:MAG: C39 family peptidase [Candidatus Ventricola sp.]
MKKGLKLLLCLAVAGALLPMTANAESENKSVSVEETAAISENKAPEAEVVADQMKEYYLSETGPQGNTFYASGASAISLPETDGEENGKLLEVPLYRQSHNFTCGVACVASVLRYAGYDFDTREDRLLWALAATPENGTSYVNIAEYLDAVRLEGFPDTPVFATEIVCTDYASDEHDLTLDLLSQFRADLDDGTPVICVIQAWRDDGYTAGTEDDGHYVVLVGYRKDAEKESYIYYFMDPSTSGSYTYLTEEEFILRWHDNLEGKPTRIAIAVSYLNAEQCAPIHAAYHLD